MKIDAEKVRLHYEFNEPEGSCYNEYLATWHDDDYDRDLSVCIRTNGWGQGLFWMDCGGAEHQSLGTCQFAAPKSDKLLRRWLRNAWLRRYADGDSAGFVTKERAGDMLAYVTSTYCVQDR